MSQSLFKRQDFAPRCPAGGTWWSCGYGTYFVGCCARDPCDITCAQGNLYPGGFDPTAYGTFPDATCGTGSKFYTCSAGLTFWGCCKTNACSQSGCPDGDLEPAVLNRDDLRSAYHATGGSTSIVAASTSAAITPTAAAAQAASKTPVAAIAGGAAGGAFALALLAGLLIYYCCQAKTSRKQHADTIQSGVPVVTTENDANKNMQQVPRPDAPPGYTSPHPNMYQPHISPYHGYTHHQYEPEPQELPIDSVASASYRGNRKSIDGRGHGPSELPGGENMRSELETPDTLPKNRQSEFKQQPSSMSLQGEFVAQSPGQLSPMSPATQFGGQRSSGEIERSQDWVAPANWQFSPLGLESGRDGPRGLGVSSNVTEGMNERREFEPRSQPDRYAYHGI